MVGSEESRLERQLKCPSSTFLKAEESEICGIENLVVTAPGMKFTLSSSRSRKEEMADMVD